MFRTLRSPMPGCRPILRHKGLGIAVALPAIVPAVVAVISVSSLTLSPDTISSGGAATATVTLNSSSILLVPVALSSSNPSVATVPSKIDLGEKLGSRGTFPIRSAAGSAGCTNIAAKVGTSAAKSTIFYVQPPVSNGPVTLSLSTGLAQGPTTLTGTVKVNQPTNGSVQLTSSNPAVTVPATVTLIPNEIGISIGTFPIHTTQPSAATCAIITATFNGNSSRALLKLNTLFFG